ncbi:DUF7373 family lipoprotein [Nocardia asteroides]|uniref:DUF7373 family lipoprotein n=1 Tax=Nocardia asteroides TaxID=1824 RepID=UPI001E374FB9|nr:hypothetical protein [Nocardia asteroides]UGT53532.1 hypothetical protein LTT85_22955 [Nocardia asteroides]
MRRTSSALLAAGLAVTIAATTGCGSDDGGTSAQPTIDVTKLDVGNLPVEPKVYGKPTNMDMAGMVEAMRIGNAMPLPMEIEPEAKYAPSAMGGAVRIFVDYESAAIKSRMSADPAKLNERAPGFITGFVTTARSNAEPALAYELDNIAMLFNTEQDAAKAAEAFAAEEAATDPDAYFPQVGTGVGHLNDVRAQMSPKWPGMIKSWKPIGRFVIFTYVYDSVMGTLKTADEQKLVARAQKSINTIAPALQKFTPTPVDKMMDLDVDPDGMLGRAMHTISLDSNQRGIPGAYDRHGGLQLTGDTEDMAKLFEESGVDRVSWQGNFVFRAKDPAGAAKIVDYFGDSSKFLRDAPAPANLPTAKCLEYVGPDKFATKYYCSVSYDRYATQVAATQLIDVHQRVAAQYTILAKAK